MATTKARLYKYVTPPSFKGGGITVKVGDKVVTAPEAGVVRNIKAINSLGATTNSIAIMMEEMKTSMMEFTQKSLSLNQEALDLRREHLEDEKVTQKKLRQDAKKKEGLEQDKRAEEKQEGKGDKEEKQTLGERSKKTAAGIFGFLKGLASIFSGIFKTMIVYSLLEWLSKEENIKKIEKLIDGIKGIGQFLINTYGTLVGMGLDGLVEFLENPLSFEGIFGMVKFLTALGLVFAPLAMGKLGLNVVLAMFGKGTLIKNLKGMFIGVGKMIMGLFSFIKGRGGLALAIAAGTGLFLAGSAFDDQEGATDADIDEQVKASSEEEVIKSLEEQLKGLNMWDKVWGKENAIKEQISRLKTGERKEYGAKGNNVMSNIPIIGGLFGGGQQPAPEEKAVGGKVKGKYAGGGWISGPQSGYPVSLDGGKSTSFIGHGTEWVGRRSGGGEAFVIPFDTPATRGKNGLTQMRMQQAKAGGYGLPGFAKGGMFSTKNDRARDGHPGENKLVGMERFTNKKPKKASGGKIFLHWTAGAKNFKQKGYYHSIVQGDGSIYRAHPYTQRSGVNHTHLRNSQGIGLSVAAMAGAPGSFQWASPKQYESMAAEVARIAKDRKWKDSDISVKNVMTHAEAASGKDGQLPDNDNYGPVAWDGEGVKWDLFQLYKGGADGSGGPDMRNMVRKMLGMKEIPPSEDAGSDTTVTEQNKKGTDTTASKQSNNNGGGSDSEQEQDDGPMTLEKLLAFFGVLGGKMDTLMGQSGFSEGDAGSNLATTPSGGDDTSTLLSQFDTNGQNLYAKPMTSASVPFSTDLDLGISTDSFKFQAPEGMNFNADVSGGISFEEGMNMPMSVGGSLCPWCKKKRAAGGPVNWDPLMNLIATKESGSLGYEAMYPSTKLKGATKMTINEVAQKATGAVGKYQQKPEFLVGRAKKAGLDPAKDLYNAKNQEIIIRKANIEKERKGLQWAAGKISDAEFMQLLAMEFASLPNAQGQFYYPGQSSNMKPEAIAAALKKVKTTPKYDPNKTYKGGDIVEKDDGKHYIFDGASFVDMSDPNAVTMQGTVEDTKKSFNTGGVSVDPTTGEETPHSQQSNDGGNKGISGPGFMEKLNTLLGQLNNEDPDVGFQWYKDKTDASALTPKGDREGGDSLLKSQAKKDADKAAKVAEGDTASSQVLPPVSAGGNKPPMEMPQEVQIAGGSAYEIPANAYARPRFGLSAELAAAPYSIA